jgi:hypothetical protein
LLVLRWFSTSPFAHISSFSLKARHLPVIRECSWHDRLISLCMSIPGIMVLPFSDCYGWAKMSYQLEPLAGGSGRNRHGETERQSGSMSPGDCNTASTVVGIAMLRPTVTPSSKAIASMHRERQSALASMSSRFMFDAKSRVNDTSCSVPNIHRNLSLSSTTITCNGISLQKPCIASNQALSAADPLHSAKAP